MNKPLFEAGDTYIIDYPDGTQTKVTLSDQLILHETKSDSLLYMGTYQGVSGQVHDAIIKIHQREDDDDEFEEALAEVKCLHTMPAHPSIITLLDSSYIGEVEAPTLNLFIIFERLHTDFHTYLNHNIGGWTADLTKAYMKQLLSALHWCHSHGVVHQDVKPSNILMRAEPGQAVQFKLCDFGNAYLYEEGVREPIPRDEEEEVTSLYWRAPELILPVASYTQAIDIWSLGCILGGSLISSNRNLFRPNTPRSILNAQFEMLGSPTTKSWPGLSTHSWEAVRSLPNYQRKTLKKAYSGHVERKGLDLLSKMLVLNPEKRISAQQALAHPYISQ